MNSNRIEDLYLQFFRTINAYVNNNMATHDAIVSCIDNMELQMMGIKCPRSPYERT